nr:hypothetical protein [Butyrivibrio sp.]
MRLVIVGAGAFGKTVKDVAAQSNKYDSIIFLDDAATEAAGKVKDFKNFIDDDTEFLVAFGNNELRYNTLEAISTAGGKVG